MRLLHKVLAQGTDESIQLMEPQGTFKAGIDGYRVNIVLVDVILRSRYNVHECIYVATLDTTKAFNSLQHSGLTADNQSIGLSPEVVEYLGRSY